MRPMASWPAQADHPRRLMRLAQEVVDRLPRRAMIWRGLRSQAAALLFVGGALLAAACPVAAQPLDLTHGGPITVTAQGGIQWLQQQQEVIAYGDAHAVRGNVTVAADRLIAFYRKKAAGPDAVQTAAASPGGAPQDTTDATDTSGNEIYRLRAEGNVHIFTPTDYAQGDVAVYDIDQAVLVMTGRDLKLTTPNEVLTARDTMEYWTQQHMAVARGDAVVVTKDARRLAADVLVAYTSNSQSQPASTAATPAPAAPAKPANEDDALAASGKLEKVNAFGHVSVRTPTDMATGDRAVYVPDTGIAILLGNVHITRGQNELHGQEAEVNMKTGFSQLLRGSDPRVTGLVVPNDTTNQSLGTEGALSRPGGSPAGTPAAKPGGAHP
jgi:lipopolysaccharide export system protein LptA